MVQGALEFEDDGTDPTFSVRELGEAINQVLRRGFGDEGVWVRGEIEGISFARNGHVYFNLTERTAEGQGTMPVACFANTFMRMVRPALAKARLRLENGLSIRLHGNVNLYAPSGRISVVMDGIDTRFTLGGLAADRDRLLRRLLSEGALDRNRRCPVPDLPLTIGVVTSVGTAAWHDFHHELESSGYGFRLKVCDTRVQGQGSAERVAAAIATVAESGVDLVVVVRGGGSKSDLATFDDELIARAIVGSPVAVFTGLGHEIDRAIADEVAHTSYKTPTACAAALITRVRDHAARLDDAWLTVHGRAVTLLERADGRVVLTAGRVADRSSRVLELADARLAHVADRARRQPIQTLARHDVRLQVAADRVSRSAPRALTDAERVLHGIEARVASLDPVRTLARGWSITRRAEGSLVREAADVQPGDVLVTTFAASAVTSRVEPAGDLL